MLDPIYFQEKTPELEKALKNRGAGSEIISTISELSKRRKELIQQTELLKAKRNSASQEIAQLKAKSKTDPAAAAEAEKRVVEMRAVGDEIKVIDEQLKSVESKFTDLAMRIPNIPHTTVPVGAGAEQNVEIRKWGTPRTFSFEPKDHVAIGEALGILDFERASKLSGARFALYLGAAATLERVLIQFMLDTHTGAHGYREVIPPFLVNRETMTGTGQLPKFEEDLFKTSVGAQGAEGSRELFLIPTSEVPLTNIYRDEIIDGAKLPIYMTAYSPCFRSEAGSYGKDTRGLIRQHQFQKVELVKIVEAEASSGELESMVRSAEFILQSLELPYRVMLLCTGDMGFSAQKTYDLEVWLPSQKSYREISSCSNCGDFQARRAGIRHKTEGKPRFVHTLNGSGLAVGRTFLALLENGQDEHGNVRIPKVLHPYLDQKAGFTRENGELWIKA
jgi:seryl-tRNA synthetase